MVLRPKKFLVTDMLMVVLATPEFAEQAFINWLPVTEDVPWTGWSTRHITDQPDDQGRALKTATDAGYWVKPGESWHTPAPADVIAVLPEYLAGVDPAAVSSIILQYNRQVF